MTETTPEEEVGPGGGDSGSSAPVQGHLFGPADEVEDNRSTAGKALEAQIAPDVSPSVPKAFNPGYGMSDDEREGSYDLYAVEGNDTGGYIGVNAEYRGYSNDTEKPYDFEDVEGDSVDAIEDASNNDEAVRGPEEHAEA